MALRLGLLSTARINREILRGAAETGEVEVVAVASRERGRAEAYAREHGLARAYGSYDELLAADDVDAVYNPLPNALHVSWSERAVGAGKHVLCEKPLSPRPRDVERLFDRAEQAGLVVAEAFMHRHHPQTRRVADLVEAGAIGRLRAITAAFSFPLADVTNIRMLSDLEGGALMDLGCYCVSGSRLLAGEPERVSAEQTTGPTGVDVAFHGTMRFQGDVVAQFDASFLVPHRQSLQALGEEGALVVEAPWRQDWGGRVLIRRDGEVEVVEVEAGGAYAAELVDFAAAVRGEREPLLGRDDAVGQARAIEALIRAADEGRAVAL